MTVSKVVHEFHSRGTRCAAWLYLPQGPEPHPCVVMACGFAGTRRRLSAYAERFAAAGMAVYVFEYRGARDRNGQSRQRLSIRRQLADWHAAVETARHLDAVDADRIALWGSSFSAGHVLTIAARDPAVAAVISQGPHLTGLAATVGPKGRCVDHWKLTAAGLRDGVNAVFRLRPYYIPVVGPPGTVAALTASESEPGYRPVAASWENRVAARVALPLPSNRPAGRVQRIQASVLYCVAEQDPVTPADAVDAVAERTPRGGVKHYPVTHFGVESGETFDRLVSDQVDFLHHALRLDRIPGPVPDSGTRNNTDQDAEQNTEATQDA